VKEDERGELRRYLAKGGHMMSIKSLSDIEAIEARPLADFNLPASTYDALVASAKRSPYAKALSFFLKADSYDRAYTWTYAELIGEITRAANAFHSFGVTQEHPVAFVLPNLPETHFTIWGGEAAGLVLAINPMLEASQIAQLLRTARARVLVILAPTPIADLWERLSGELIALPDLRVVAWVDMAAYLGSPAAARPPASAFPFEIVDMRAAMRDQPADRLVSSRKIKAADASSYVCTGGTTGLPKIAVRTHGNEVFDAWAVAKLVEEENTAPRTRFCGLPLFHVNAQLVTGLLPWMRGDHVVLGTPEGYRAKGLIQRFWEIVAHYRVSSFSGVPTIYSALLQTPINNNDISSLQYAICGAAPMPASLIEAFESKTGIRVIEGYGLTEATCASSITPPDGKRAAGSIGLRIPYQQMRAVILDAEGRFVRMADIDEIGVIAIHGPNVFPGYLNPRHNESAWIEINGERWLNTGDLGRQDGSGYFWLSGRKKELIIRGGHNIDPKIIEEALQQHPAVALAAAIGSPDAYAGEVPVAYVQPKPEAAVTEAELAEFAARHIPERAAIPKYIRVSPSLPLTAVGKIFKPALQQLELGAIIRAEASRAGATISEINIDRDSKFGLVARVRVAGNAQPLRTALSRYAFRSELSNEQGASDAARRWLPLGSSGRLNPRSRPLP
jgi:fatty-acyl-CoA synthase